MDQKSNSYDVIVAGVGGMGSSACYHLSKRGLNVLGLEQFRIPHDKGSSHGETRVIRKAYFEHPDYVPLLERSYELWQELEEEAGQEIFNRCGLVTYADRQTSPVYRETLQSARMHSIAIEEPEPEEAVERWPQYRPPGHYSAIYEPDAGFLYAAKAIKWFTRLAHRNGATILENQEVLQIDSGRLGVSVQTPKGDFHAKKLVLTAGSWAGKLLGKLNIPFSLLRKTLSWHPAGDVHNLNHNTPCAIFELGEHFFYLFPMIDGKTIKIGKHTGGEPITDPSEKEVAGPPPSYLQPLKQLTGSHLPHVSPDYSRFVTCLYTNTPDRHFLIDCYPSDPNIVFAAGFSGHGFKFCSVVGEILADLATGAPCPLLTAFLKMRNFSE